mmetsp:Transcript_100824/g.256517  ORF Transcript_100824/g.256517 Transcript_100824/m.256517 type:complete len:530 (+) Transcript_100824:86-1675(+)
MRACTCPREEEEEEDGEEEANEVEYSLKSLRGKWKDTKGSTYDVDVEADKTVVIKTTRPTGKVISTRGLVRLDEKTNWIIWGRSGPRTEYWLSKLDPRSLVWDRDGSAAFEWLRIGEAPGKSETENEPEEEAASENFRQDMTLARAKLRQQFKQKRKETQRKETQQRNAAVEKSREEEAWKEEGWSDEFGREDDWKEDEKVAQPGRVKKANMAATKEEAESTLKKLIGMRECPSAGAGLALQHVEDVEQASPYSQASSEHSCTSAPAAVWRDEREPPSPAPPTPHVAAAAASVATGRRGKSTRECSDIEAQLLAALREGGASVDCSAGDSGAGSSGAAAAASTDAVRAEATSGIHLGNVDSHAGILLASHMQQHGALPQANVPSGCCGTQPPGGQDTAYIQHLQQVVHGFLGGRVEGGCCGGHPGVAGQYQMSQVDPRHICDQLLFYFSDHNLARDAYLRNCMTPNDGWVELWTLHNFQRMRSLGANFFALQQAAAASPEFELDGSGVFLRIRDPQRRAKWVTQSGGYQ